MKQFTVKMKCVIYKTAIFECESIEESEGFPLEHAVRVAKTDVTDWEVIDVKEEK